ncbi:S-layer homology domain-containing protein [Lysinibacillus sp. NPDC093712]|uniref:S-layer homology domain-containing protein n=1 Tax=Lysinibacillus sp. NPDC093712 TaxID=3390579 RepID=UPI003D00DD4F
MKHEINKKQQLIKKSKMTKKSKALMISAITTTAVASLVGVQNAEASNYMWSKYNVDGIEEVLWSGNTISYSNYIDFTEQIAIYEKQGYSNVFGRSFNVGFETDEFGAYTGRIIYAHTLYGTKYTKGILVGTIQAGLNAYENNVRNSDGYWYERGQIVNDPPSTPTLTIPNEAFEHGDKRFISFGATDPNGDTLTYTLRASYDEGKTWSDIYKGTSKVFEYTVPSDKTNVQFRVLASDGMYTVSSAVSAKKDIREVMYQWGQYTALMGVTETVIDTNTGYGHHGNQNGGPSYVWGNTGYIVNGTNYEVTGSTMEASDLYPVTLYAVSPDKKTLYKNYNYLPVPSSNQFTYTQTQYQMQSTGQYQKGGFIKYLEGGDNVYINGARNSDGYWYEKGPRVSDGDTTPPIIELTEQSEYAPTSTVVVKVYDLSAIKSVKYAKGEQSTGYFASNGTAVTGEKFVATENGNYTVYAEDAKGNKIVQIINVTKVNNAPTLPTLTVPEVPFEHGDKQFIQFGSTDADGQTITYTLEALYDGSNTPVQLYQGTDRTFGYTVPNDKTKVQFRVKATDGIATTQYTTGEPQNIREVQYYWNKFQFRNQNSQRWVNRHEQYPMYSLTDEQWKAKIKAIEDNPNYRLNYAHFSVDPVGYNLDYDELVTDTYQVKTFINTLQAGYNTYPDQKLHTDGYWYERGQRVLSEDVTPPIIELTEQAKYDTTSTVEVKVHDLSAIKAVKYAKGEQTTDYFASSGTSLTDGQFTVTENGKYTVFAEDIKGNKAVEIINVTKVNSPPVVNSIEAVDKFNVVDDTTDYSIRGVVSDMDGQSQSVKVTYNGKTAQATVNGNGFEAILKGSEYEKGYHQSNISVVSNDGFVDSESKTLEHIVIKVDNAADYTRDLNAHSEEPDNYSATQHEAFYNAYESILSYEAQRSADALQNANEKLATLKASTVSESVTLTNWQNRLDLITAIVVTEEAEKNLSKEDFEKAKELVEALIPSSGKDQLEERINELQRYHEANDAIAALEDKSESVSWDKINEAQDKVKVVENTDNQKELQDRLTQVIKDYLSDLTTITSDDLDKFGVSDVVVENSDLYDEFKDAFKPLGENTNAQDLVDFVNALKAALSDVTPSAVNTLNSKVPDYAKEVLSPVVTTMDKLLDKRQTFTLDDSKEQSLKNSIQNVSYEITKTYMNTINTAMKEVIEYNDTHDANEKSEAHNATEGLWQGQLRTDMQSYLDNGIPEIIVVGDVYEYINNGKLNVIASIQDTNDTTHEVKVSFNGDTKTVTSTDGKINVSFDLQDGVYEDHVTIVAKDKLTEKTHTIMNKPVVVVSDVEMYKRFAQALEADKGQSFDAFDQATHTALKTLFDKTLAIKINVSSEREIREVENSATKLGGKNGQLETLVKSLVQSNRLVWLINNYQIATDDDFAWAGVEGVTFENIEGLKSIINDYVASFNGLEVKTPTVDDYHNWLNLNAILEEAKSAIEIAEGLHSKEELVEAISKAEAVLEKVPSWLSAKTDLQERLDAVIAYYDVIESVITSETSYIQVDKDTAQSLVDKLVDGTPKNNLQTRLDAVQVVIDAIEAVETVETSLEEDDQVIAQSLVDKIGPTNAKKAELQARLDAIVKIKEAIAAVEQVESNKTQQDLDIAKELVDALPNSPIKEELLDRLQTVQDAIDNKSREEQAIDAVSHAEDTLQKTDKDKAQEKVDALEEGKLKEDLQNRLDALQQHVDNYPDAEKLVIHAEGTKQAIDVDAAQSSVDELPDSKAKTDLQQRLDVVSAYIKADQAVSKAEANLMQKHKNDAQTLVDDLSSGEDKDALQKRLDAVQIAIDNKQTDLLDKIINDLDNVTAGELADYTGQEVFEELLPEYIEGIGKLGDTVTKEQVIKVVKVISSLELAKREMKETFINAYEKEYMASDLPTLKNYPQPAALSSIVDYLHDEDALEKVISEIAIALNVTEDFIRSEIEAILKDVSDDATTGKYLVQYVDENGTLIDEKWITEVPYGEVVVNGIAPEGYEILNEEIQTFTLSDETANQIISFVVKAQEVNNEEPEEKEESEESTEADIPTDKVEEGQIEEDVIPDKEEDQNTETSEQIETNETENTQPGVEIKKFSVDDLKSLNLGLNLQAVEASLLDTYLQHIQDYAAEKEATMLNLKELIMILEAIHAAYEQEQDAETKISKLDDGAIKTMLMDLIKPQSTIGLNTSLVRSKMLVASLNDDYIRVTTTPYGKWGTENENHAEYVFKTFYALASVKAYQSAPSQKYKEEVKDYIAVNLHDGSYKELLLAELGYKIDEIGTTDDGKPDLTVVKPTPPVVTPKPPIIDPPVVEPPVVEPPVVVDPPVNPQPTPEPPVVKPPETGTVAETIGYENNKWTIENPGKKEVILTQDGITIKIPLEMTAKKWEVEWLPKANHHFKLRILADGKEVSTFKQPIEITKEQKKAYVLRHEDGQYSAVPFKFEKPNNLNFKINHTGEFYFSTQQVKFRDIEGVFSQDAIEELANRHIVMGTSDGYYSPYRALTRAQFSAMLVRSLGLEATGTHTFKDVKGNDWFANDVQALYDAGIIRGVSATKFNPNGTLTRQQAALMLERTLDYLKVDKGTFTLNFSDADKISEEAKPAVAIMQGLGIFNGKQGNNFDPYSNLTRAQMAKVLLNTLEIADVF